jgi:2-hydroxy-6-oxonona-2,4-dienedioate hydrolase
MDGGMTMEPRGATESAPDYLARMTAAGEIVTTPCGDGEMVWHIYGDGPPLMLVHGGYGGWAHWIRNIPELSRHYRLLLPDLPGHGDSAMPPEPISGHGLAEIVADGLDRLLPAGAACDVAGFSFGGIVSGCLAEQMGDRIHNLVICGSNGLGLPRTRLSGFKHWKGITDPDELAEAHRTNLAILMFADPANIDDLAIHIQASNTPKARIKSRLIAVTDVLGAALPKVTARLAGIWGERDSYAEAYMDTRRDLFQSAQPGCPFRVIEGAGHWAMYEFPDRFNAVFLDILGGGKA